MDKYAHWHQKSLNRVVAVAKPILQRACVNLSSPMLSNASIAACPTAFIRENVMRTCLVKRHGPAASEALEERTATDWQPVPA